MAIRREMGMYEPIKGNDDSDVGILINRNMKNDASKLNAMHAFQDDEDVEMALRISHSFSPTLAAVTSANAKANADPSGDIRGAATNKIEGGPFSSKNLQPQPQQKQRLASLDVFRGLTVALMLLVDYAGGALPAINHSPWNGITLADYVMPFFLFIVGVSLALAYKKLPSRAIATQNATLRALKLLILGLFLQGGFLHGINDLTYGVNIEKIRWMGILQRIAIAYLVGALCEIWLKGNGDVNSGSSLLKNYQFQWIVAFILTTLYLSLSYGLYVPDWEYQLPSQSSSSTQKIFSVKCGVRGNTGPGCNAAGMIDRAVLGIQHLYKRPIYARTEQCSINFPNYGPLPSDAPAWCQAPFDPEGILSSVMAIVTCLIGLHFGHIIIQFEDHKKRILCWMVSSSGLVLLGLVLDLFGMHINKALYSFSYTSVTAGAAGFLFSGIYLMVDVLRCRRPTMVMEWMGMHALMIYALAACNILPVFLQGFYWRHPQNNILRSLGIAT